MINQNIENCFFFETAFFQTRPLLIYRDKPKYRKYYFLKNCKADSWNKLKSASQVKPTVLIDDTDLQSDLIKKPRLTLQSPGQHKHYNSNTQQ